MLCERDRKSAGCAGEEDPASQRFGKASQGRRHLEFDLVAVEGQVVQREQHDDGRKVGRGKVGLGTSSWCHL